MIPLSLLVSMVSLFAVDVPYPFSILSRGDPIAAAVSVYWLDNRLDSSSTKSELLPQYCGIDIIYELQHQKIPTVVEALPPTVMAPI